MKIKAVKDYKWVYSSEKDVIAWEQYEIELWFYSWDWSVAFLPNIVTNTWQLINNFKVKGLYTPITSFDTTFLFSINKPMNKLQELKSKKYFTKQKKEQILESSIKLEEKILDINSKIESLQEEKETLEQAFENIELWFEYCDVDKLEKWLSML